jgi:predicted amidohydrolase
MKIACIQLTTSNIYKKNFTKILKFLNNSIKLKADLIITPEASTILSDNKMEVFDNSYSFKDDPLIKEIKNICQKYKKWVLIGSLFIKSRNKLRNRSVLINPNGKIVKYYDKINMFDVELSKNEKYFESKTFEAGKKIKYANLPWGRLGLTICYDIRFPELYRKLSKHKINFISIPSAFTKTTGRKHWIALLRARAIENFCYIFAPNQTGKNTNKRQTFGHSAIISPDGKILSLLRSKEGIITAKIDPELPFKLRKKIPSLRTKLI